MNVIGHDQQKLYLKNMLKSCSVPHALLFSGPEAVGKRTLAHQLAATLLSKNPENTEEVAENQKLICAGNHPDVHRVSLEDGKKDISVESIRTLCSALSLHPYSGVASVSIIDHAHRMNSAASNALLTTLESPPGNAYIILISESSHRLPATILSRCQGVHFGELSSEELSEVITELLPFLEKEALDGVMELLDGSLAALQMEEFINPATLSISDQKATASYITALLQESEKFQAAAQTLIAYHLDAPHSGIAQAVSLVSEMSEQKESIPLFFQALRRELREELKKSHASKTAFWAELLEDSIEAEQLIYERNLSPQLQLTDLLCRL